LSASLTSTLLEILSHDILPIFVVIGLGYVFARRTHPDIRVLSRLTFYIFSPSLVFVSLVESNIEGGEFVQIAAYVISVTLIMGGLAWLSARALHLTPGQTGGFVLTAMFVNSGNYGLGVTRLAFGADAEARAIVYYVTSSVMVYTLGVLIATGFKGGRRGVVKQLFSMPHIYALTVALTLRGLNLTVPRPLLDGLTFPANAAIPMMLVLLGMQLASARVGENWRPALAGSGLRLLVAPIVALALAMIYNLGGPARQAGVLEASMPAAVITTLLATEFDAEPKLVTGTVVVSTLISPLTLTVVIAMLQHL
jgi:predicted permease